MIAAKIRMRQEEIEADEERRRGRDGPHPPVNPTPPSPQADPLPQTPPIREEGDPPGPPWPFLPRSSTEVWLRSFRLSQGIQPNQLLAAGASEVADHAEVSHDHPSAPPLLPAPPPLIGFNLPMPPMRGEEEDVEDLMLTEAIWQSLQEARGQREQWVGEGNAPTGAEEGREGTVRENRGEGGQTSAQVSVCESTPQSESATRVGTEEGGGGSVEEFEAQMDLAILLSMTVD